MQAALLIKLKSRTLITTFCVAGSVTKRYSGLSTLTNWLLERERARQSWRENDLERIIPERAEETLTQRILVSQICCLRGTLTGGFVSRCSWHGY